MPIITIARLTLREASRRRLFLAVAILTAILAFFTGWAFHKIIGIPCGGGPCSHVEIEGTVAALLILLVFMFSFIVALGGAFVAAPAVSGDIESGIFLAILPRPIRRAEVIAGKWLGLCILLTIYGAAACVLELMIVRIVTGYVPPHPVFAIIYLVGEAAVVVTLTLLASTRLPAMTTGVSVVILFGLVWIAGIAGTIGQVLGNKTIENVGTVSSLLFPTDGLWRGTLYNLEPSMMLAAVTSGGTQTRREALGNSFLALAPPTNAYVIWVFVWLAMVLGVAVWSFNKREL